jgi:hypothetical protein
MQRPDPMPKFDLFVPLKIQALKTCITAGSAVEINIIGRVRHAFAWGKDSPASFIFSKVQNAILT